MTAKAGEGAGVVNPVPQGPMWVLSLILISAGLPMVMVVMLRGGGRDVPVWVGAWVPVREPATFLTNRAFQGLQGVSSLAGTIGQALLEVQSSAGTAMEDPAHRAGLRLVNQVRKDRHRQPDPHVPGAAGSE